MQVYTVCLCAKSEIERSIEQQTRPALRWESVAHTQGESEQRTRIEILLPQLQIVDILLCQALDLSYEGCRTLSFITCKQPTIRNGIAQHRSSLTRSVWHIPSYSADGGAIMEGMMGRTERRNVAAGPYWNLRRHAIRAACRPYLRGS